MEKITIHTPCIGICSTVYGDNVCRGCKRFSHEIIQWNQYSAEQKTKVWDRLTKLQSQILQQKIHITDSEKLKQFSQQQKLRMKQNLSLYSWAFQVISQAADRIEKLESCGLTALPNYRHLDCQQLANLINDEYYALSLAHFDISFTRHEPAAGKK